MAEQWVVVYRHPGQERYVVRETAYQPDQLRPAVKRAVDANPDADVWAAPSKKVPYLEEPT